MRRLHIAVFAAAAGCGGDVPYEIPPYADLTGATALVLYGSTGTEPPDRQGLLARVMEGGGIEPVFPPVHEGEDEEGVLVRYPLPVDSLEASESGSALVSVHAHPFRPIGASEEDPPIWCGMFTFPTDEAQAPLSCVTPDPLQCAIDDEGAAEGACIKVESGRIAPDGTVWGLGYDFETDQDGQVLWAFVDGVATRATPLALDQAELVAAEADGVVVRVGDDLEIYRLQPDARVDFDRLPLHRVVTHGARNIRYRGALLVEDLGPNRLRLLDVETAVTSVIYVDQDESDCFPGQSGGVLSDGEVLYAMGQTVEGDKWCRCGTDGVCGVVGEDEAAVFERVDLYSVTLGTRMAFAQGGSGALHFFAQGVISPNFASDLVIRDITVLGEDIYFSGVNAENEGGLFRVDFDGAAFSFTAVQGIEGEGVVELIPLDPPG